MNQLTVETRPSTINRLDIIHYMSANYAFESDCAEALYSRVGGSYSVVKFIVNVKLMEKSVKSHVGSVIVEKVITQYKTLGIVWKTREKTQPIHPTMVVGVGGDNNGGGGRWLEKLGKPETLALMAGSEVDREVAATEGMSERESDACRESRSGRSGEGTDAPLSAILTLKLGRRPR